ncbi:MAG: hypothetical protein LBT47_13280 [Deltaproteobacteria bacterium]|nr:hypothetical protein [Deltaproteobacteria bacterium]
MPANIREAANSPSKERNRPQGSQYSYHDLMDFYLEAARIQTRNNAIAVKLKIPV